MFAYSLTPGANAALHQKKKTCHSHQYDNFSVTVGVLHRGLHQITQSDLCE